MISFIYTAKFLNYQPKKNNKIFNVYSLNKNIFNPNNNGKSKYFKNLIF